MKKNTQYRDKARGMLIGLAIGDALGAPVQFGNSSEAISDNIDTLRHMHDNHVLPKGVWTDDTSMALCIADSLLECGGYDSYDMMDKYKNWMAFGYRSYFDFGYDIGMQTSRSIVKYSREPVIPKNAKKEWNAGNGAIMRLAPVVIANTFIDKKYPTEKEVRGTGGENEWIELEDISPTLEMARLSCRETHNSIAAEAVTEFFASTLYCALHGLSKANIVTYCNRWVRDEELDSFWLDNSGPLINRVFDKTGNDFKDLGGYIVDAFAIALWGLVNFDTFEEGMLKVISLGGDTDTNGAIYGQLAGAFYGYDAIPKEWINDVYLSEEIIELADKLLEMKECPVIQTRFEDDEHFVDTNNKGKTTRPSRKDDSVASIGELLKKYKLKDKQ